MTLGDELFERIRRIAAVLDHAGVRHVLMGGIAANVWSVPTPTYDLDLTLDLPRDDVDRMVDLLQREGFHPPLTNYVNGVGVERFPKVSVHFDFEGRMYDVDLFLAEHPIQRSALDRGIRIEIDTGLYVPVMTVEDLLLHKLIAYRPKDRATIQRLMIMQPDIDRGYMDRWLDRLHLRSKWEDALRDAEPLGS